MVVDADESGCASVVPLSDVLPPQSPFDARRLATGFEKRDVLLVRRERSTRAHAGASGSGIGIGMLAGRNRNLRPLRRGRHRGRAGCCDAGARGVGIRSRGRLAPPRRQRGGASRARSATSLERGVYRECCRLDQPGSWADRAASGGGHRYPSSRCAVDERGWSPAVGPLKVLSARGGAASACCDRARLDRCPPPPPNLGG